MPEVNVKVQDIEGIKLTTKNIKEKDLPDRKLVQVTFLADINPADVARILQFDRSGQPIDVAISSPQAMFDLRLERVNLNSGEILDQ